MARTEESEKPRAAPGGVAHVLGACFATSWGMNLGILLTVGPARGTPGTPGGTAMEGAQGNVYALAWLAMIVVPGIVALVVRVLRKETASALGRPTVRWRGYVHGYLLAVAFVVTALTLSVLCGLAGRNPEMERQLAQAFPVSGMGAVSALLLYYILVIPFLLTLVMVLEEYGWRGYLLTRLPQGRGLTVVARNGLLWALWSLPFVLLIRLYGETTAWIAVPVALVTHTLLGASLAYLALRFRSVWIPALAQAVLQSQLGLHSSFFTLEIPTLAGPFGLLGAALCALFLGWAALTGRLERAVEDAGRLLALEEA